MAQNTIKIWLKNFYYIYLGKEHVFYYTYLGKKHSWVQKSVAYVLALLLSSCKSLNEFFHLSGCVFTMEIWCLP